MTAALVLLVLLGYVLAALLSAGEVAVARATRAQVAQLVAEGHPAARRVARLTADPVRVADSASFVRLMSEMTATVAVTLWVDASTDWPWWGVLAVCLGVSAAVAWGLVRVSPRTIGRRHPVRTLVVIGRLLVVVTTLVGGLSRTSAVVAASEPDEDELRAMVDRVAESPVIDEEERQMVRSVMELGDTLTREVMVPRTDMVVTRAHTQLRTSLRLLLRSGFSRLPVIGDSVDDLRGVLYLKDIVRHAFGPSGDLAALDDLAISLARPARFVPESKPVDDLLRELRDASAHIAMVVDEYGGIAGLVTMEDALEEIVGELTDEHDPSAPAAEAVGDGVFRVPARMGRDELGDLFGREVDDEDVDTAGGLLAKALGKVPLPGSAGVIHGLHLTAERVEGRRRRLATVLVRRSTPSEEDGRVRTRNLDR
ncbi:MAG: hemolysin family protein [Micrococcales bacterium]|nr:hemolysin family protein [Micrococcales bacterium]